MLMKRVLILTYFFPPGNFAGSYRIQSWAKYLIEFGYYPVVVTRKWEETMNDYSDMSKQTSEGIEHHKFENFEVYYLPYKPNRRDRLLAKHGKEKYLFYRKVLTFIEIFFQNITNSVIPFRNLYSFSKHLLKNNPDIKLVITSGKPFILFKFCYFLKKKYNVKWVADYRDDWNSTQWKIFYNKLQLIFLKIETFFEKKWVSSADHITSVSDYYVNIISAFVNKNGSSIMNGYDESDYPNNAETYFNDFTIVYNGTLYNSQPIEIFLEGLKKVIDRNNNVIKIKILFPGLSVDSQMTDEVRANLKGYEDNYEITGRIKKEEVISIQLKSHVLLMIGHTGIKGTTSSKIFEYLACKKNILLCPSDNDIIERIITETGSGIICNSSVEIEEKLQSLINEYLKTGKIKYNSIRNEIEKYSRRNQTKKLAEVFDKIEKL